VASSAVTSGTFAVAKASDGTAFFADAAATTVGNNRTRRSITTTLIEPDEIYLITATAIIDSGARQAFAQLSGAALLQTIGRAGTTAVATSADLKASLTATDAAIATVDANVDAILLDTAEIGTAGAGLTDLATASALATVDNNVDAILVDTGTTLPATLATIDGIADAILVDTGTTIPGTIATVDANVDAILLDTGTTLPATLTTIEGKVDTVDGVVDSIVIDIAALNDVAAADVATAILDAANGIETGVTPRQALRGILSALGAKVSGMESNAPVFRDVGDTKDRITAATDSNGNRTSVTLDLT